jgi:hypothetical protein
MRSAFERIFVWVIIGGLLALVGFATHMAYRYGVDIYKAYVLSGTWESTTGTIASSKATQDCGKGGRGYSLDVTYNYIVGGTEFKSAQIWFGNGYCSGKSGADIMVSRYLVGAQTFVYFNPKAPYESVLVRGHVENGTIFLFLLMLCAPLGAIALLIKSAVVARQQPRPPSIAEILKRREQLDRSIRVEIQERSNGR